MVTVTIDGKRSAREFQNMAQALGFAVLNGECLRAERVEIAYGEKAGKPGEKAGKAETGAGASEGGGGGKAPEA